MFVFVLQLIMGSVCSRRQSTARQAAAQEAEQTEWLLIPPARRHSLQRAARRVLDLLRLRKLWHRLGQWLSRASKTRPSTVCAIQAVFAELGRLFQKRKRLTDHVVRVRGRLRYRKPSDSVQIVI